MRGRSSPIHVAADHGFARAADDYERGRPTYPEEAIKRLAAELRLGPGSTVLDLAAGTGKLTGALLSTRADVIAVEPVCEMRTRLVESLPQVTALAGTAEAIPLEEGAVDAVTVGQAFHWFDGDAALAEIHRVLRAHGRLGLVWNFRDESVEWLARLTEIMAPHRGDVPRASAGAWRTAFERTRLFRSLEHAQVRLAQELSPEGVVARVASVSFVSALPENRRSAVLDEVRELLARHPETRGRATLVVPHRTDVFWCERA